MNTVIDPDIHFDLSVECGEYSTEMFKRSFKDRNNFIVVHQNIRSFNRNGDELLLFVGCG